MDIQRSERDPLELPQHKIELDIIIPPTHQTKYKLNPNYVIVVKQDINKLLVVGFIQFVEEATWLSLIIIVPKKNGKLRIYKFQKSKCSHNETSIPITFHICSAQHNSKV